MGDPSRFAGGGTGQGSILAGHVASLTGKTADSFLRILSGGLERSQHIGYISLIG